MSCQYKSRAARVTLTPNDPGEVNRGGGEDSTQKTAPDQNNHPMGLLL